ncbi:MAG: hypothetical protein QXF49_02590 [Thermosphaera sp.]
MDKVIMKNKYNNEIIEKKPNEKLYFNLVKSNPLIINHRPEENAVIQIKIST